MELAIGTKFTYQGKTYEVIKGVGCSNCAFNSLDCTSFYFKRIRGVCDYLHRSDSIPIIYKEINKENNMQYNNTKDTVTINPPHKYDSKDYKDIIINMPEGCEVDIDNSDLAKGIIKLKRKDITLNDIYAGITDTYACNVVGNNTLTFSRIEAIATLMDIAQYYNGDWKPDWSTCNSDIYYISYQAYGYNNGYEVYNTATNNTGCIYFKNKEDAQAVIDNPNFREILDTIYKN